MNTAIVYYSLTGHSNHFVKQLSKNITCDIFRLRTEQYIPKTRIFKYLYCSIVAGLEKHHSIEEITFNSQNYDLVILVTPIWFGKLPPAFNTFFKKYTIDCEIILVYSCFVAFSHLTDLIKNKYLKGRGEIIQSYIIYDQKTSSYSKVTDKITNHIKKNKYSIHSKEIYYNLLYE